MRSSVLVIYHHCSVFSTALRFFKKIIGNNIPYITDFISKTLANNKETVIRTVTSEESIDKIMPEIDTYIQEFLTKKVPEQLPMIAMFLGKKPLIKLKRYL